jgi:hypothetical protein
MIYVPTEDAKAGTAKLAELMMDKVTAATRRFFFVVLRYIYHSPCDIFVVFSVPLQGL